MELGLQSALLRGPGGRSQPAAETASSAGLCAEGPAAGRSPHRELPSRHRGAGSALYLDLRFHLRVVPLCQRLVSVAYLRSCPRTDCILGMIRTKAAGLFTRVAVTGSLSQDRPNGGLSGEGPRKRDWWGVQANKYTILPVWHCAVRERPEGEERGSHQNRQPQ